MMDRAFDTAMMARAVQLARLGQFSAMPNPHVGCVLVRDGQIIGEGYTRPAGGSHAEIVALEAAGDARNAVAYVTLEPCSHHGKTGPCADALIAAGVRVYEYRPRMLHAKTIVIDGKWAALGTANFDYRSFFLNYELVLAVDQPSVCTQLEQEFLDDLSQSRPVTAGSWAQRRWPQRLLECVGWITRRWL